MAFMHCLLIIASFLFNCNNTAIATRVLLHSANSLSSIEKFKALPPLPKPKLPRLRPIPGSGPSMESPEASPTPTSSILPPESALTPSFPPKQAPTTIFSPPKTFSAPPKSSTFPPKSTSPAPKTLPRTSAAPPFAQTPEQAPASSLIPPEPQNSQPPSIPPAPETFFEPIQSPIGTTGPSSGPVEPPSLPVPKTVSKPKHHLLHFLPTFPKFECPPLNPWIPKTSPSPSSH